MSGCAVCRRGRHRLAGLLAVVCLAGGSVAQRGDRRGQPQPALPADLQVPPAPVLRPAEALRSLRVQPGFEVQLVAAEPLVEDPVCITFDARGRIWVVEMRGFMPNVDGTGELAENGRIVVLSDRDGDGRMDDSRVFLDGLVLPRLVTVVNQGVLVLAPPQLLLCRDLDGDGRCDQRIVLRDRLPGRSGPEHAINGGMIGLDNWIQFAKFGERLRFRGGRWEWRPQLFRGQWGITQDDLGRAFHNGNSDYLRGDLFPAHYAVRNRHFGSAPGANIQIDRDQSTWPIRVTPGINRGYLPAMLRDYKLARFTAACSPVIYRDDVFPADCQGNAFVCEPSGNFVRRSRIAESGGRLTARNAYPRDEFLASTDERFRPVDLKVGPDGGLYVVDMYRGILQHRNYVTSFLRKQILERGLDRPVGLGRIYRVLPAGAPRRPAVDLTGCTDRQLVTALGHPSGWRRDQAQRLLIGRGRRVTAAVTRATAATAPLARLHALWVLEGLDALGPAVLRPRLADADPRVRTTAVRLSERWLGGAAGLRAAVTALGADPDPRVGVQVAHSLGEARPLPLAELVTVAGRRPLDELLSGAILSGLGGQELEFLEQFTAALAAPDQGARRLLDGLVRCILAERRPARVQRLLEHAARRVTWWGDAILDRVGGELAGEARRQRRARVLELPVAPAALVARAAATPSAARVVEHLAWPGRAAGAAQLPPLSAADRRRIAEGEQLYAMRCFACHGKNGKGQPGVAPSLVGSEWVLGPPRRLIAIVTHGLSGPITVAGQEWNLLMPPVPDLGDSAAALLLSYVRNAWGNRAALVDTRTVKRVRAGLGDRGGRPFTVAELQKLR